MMDYKTFVEGKEIVFKTKLYIDDAEVAYIEGYTTESIAEQLHKLDKVLDKVLRFEFETLPEGGELWTYQ